MKKYYLGIDGGGTKTALCLIDESKEIIQTLTTSASSYDTVSQSVFKQTIENAIKSIGEEYNIVSLFVGLGGISSIKDSENVIKNLRSINRFADCKIEVANDITNALYGGLGCSNGMAVIIGTGSVAYGENNGKTHRCGGYCWQEGDSGSSYDLGRKAVQYLAKVIDGRLVESNFSNELKKELDINEFSDLAHFFINATRTQIAQIAKLVTKNSDDINAKKIIESGCEAVLEMIKTVYEKLKFNNVELAIIGSLGQADTYYKKYLFELMDKYCPNIKIIDARYEAYYGAALKAYMIDRK